MSDEEVEKFTKIHMNMILDLNRKVRFAKDSKFSGFISPSKLRQKLRRQQFFGDIQSPQRNNSDNIENQMSRWNR